MARHKGRHVSSPDQSCQSSSRAPCVLSGVAGCIDCRGLWARSSLSRHRPRHRPGGVPLRLLSRRSLDRAGARDPRADPAGRPPARLPRGAARPDDRAGGGLGAGRLAAGRPRRAAHQRHLDRHRQCAGDGRDPADAPRRAQSGSLSRQRALRRSSAPPIPTSLPILLNVTPAEAFHRVDEVAMSMGWDVVARAPNEGRIEAVDISDWFGMTDDIVVRIRPEGTSGSPHRHPLEEPRRRIGLRRERPPHPRLPRQAEDDALAPSSRA